MDHERLVMRSCGALRALEGPGDLLQPGDQHRGRAEGRMEQPEPQRGVRADRWRLLWARS
jgi:hypothetical protein